VHDVGVDQDGHFYYVMRLVRGDQTLRGAIERLRKGDPELHRQLTFERRVQIVQQVAQILEYAHSRGVVHRDVKPENIMLGPFGEVYLVDWGLAKLVGHPDHAALAAEGDVQLAPGNATEAGRLIGTPLYMAPEQALGEEVTARSDVYALTTVLYELLALEHPLGDDVRQETSLMALVKRVSEREPAFASARDHPQQGCVPRPLALVCHQGLQKDPAQRLGSMRELEAGLQTWLEGDTAALCPPTLLLGLLNAWKRAVNRNPVGVTFATLWFAFLAWPLVRLLGRARR
jgi:serine/threonine protein kinase